MKTKKRRFTGSRGDDLVGLFDVPDGEPIATALFAHCFTCTKNLKATHRISKKLTAEGIAVFRFDFTGLGESEGEFEETNLSSNVGGLLAAAEFMSGDSAAPRILIGHSLGGSAVIQAAGKVESCEMVAVIAAPSDPAHLTGVFAGERDEMERTGRATVDIGGRNFTITKQFFEDLEEHRMKQRIDRLGLPLVVIHSPDDPIVGIDHGERVFEAANQPKWFVSLDGADHLDRKSTR